MWNNIPTDFRALIIGVVGSVLGFTLVKLFLATQRVIKQSARKREQFEINLLDTAPTNEMASFWAWNEMIKSIQFNNGVASVISIVMALFLAVSADDKISLLENVHEINGIFMMSSAVFMLVGGVVTGLSYFRLHRVRLKALSKLSEVLKGDSNAH